MSMQNGAHMHGFTWIQILSYPSNAFTGRKVPLLLPVKIPCPLFLRNFKLHCKATFPLHPRSFINTVQDRPVFSAHSSVKSYVSFHLASVPAFIRGRGGGSREEAPQQPANFTAQAIAAPRVMKRLAPSWCDASRYHSPGW